MPKLLDLPNETLLQIIESTHVGDIEAFSSCNKRVRLLFGPVLRLHVERKREHSKLEFGAWCSKRRHATMLFLHEFSESPAIVHYPTELVLGGLAWRLWDWPDGYGVRSEEQKITQLADKLCTVLSDCPYIRESDRQGWESELARGNEDATVALLVTLLPNLNSITISGENAYPHHLVHVVSDIAAAQREAPNSFHPLEKLTRVHFERVSTSYGIRWYSVLGSFRKLLSVRALTGEKVVGLSGDEGIDQDEDEYEEGSEDFNKTKQKDGDKNQDREDESQHEGKPEYEAVESGGNITHLRFEDSAISARSFVMILKGINALRHFSYSYARPRNFNDAVDWEPAVILQSLLLCASHSLESLELTGVGGSWNLHVHDSPNFASSPRHFKVLKELRVQNGIFLGKEIVQKSHKESGDPKEITSWNVHRMVDILPLSLERLTLFPSFPSFVDSKHIGAAFEAFPELQESRLPRLTNIWLEGRLQVDKTVKLACTKVGTSMI